jgi:hypothetical protein
VRRRMPILLRLVALGLILGLSVVGLASGFQEGTTSQDLAADVRALLALPVVCAYLVPGLVLLFRRHWHVIGWVLVLLSFSLSVLFANGWGDRSVTPAFGIDAAWWLWLENLVLYGVFPACLVALFALFPDGLAAQPPRHRRVGRFLLGAVTAFVGLAALAADLRVVTDGPTVPSPVPFAIVPLALVEGLAVVLVLLMVASGVHLVVRARSAPRGERQQFRWILVAIGSLVAWLPVGLVMTAMTGNGAWWLPVVVGYLAVPLAITVAILRYRLYEIDRVVSRTVSYAVVVGVLGATYLGLVVVLRGLVPVSGDLPVAVSTLVVAALFLPLARRVQWFVDRRFFRSRYDAGVVMARVADDLRGSLDLADVTERVEAVVDEVLAPEVVGVWVAER